MRACSRYFIAVAFPIIAAAQTSPDLFSALQWRCIGPFRGGRAVAVSGDPGGGTTFFFGGVNGGVWQTTNAGSLWTPIFDGQPTGSIGALAVAPSDANVIYAGTGESDIRSDLSSGDGVYKSTDGGKTWRSLGLKDTRQISRIVVNPLHPNIVFVAALGHAYGPNEERGVYRSGDGGANWQKVLYSDANTGAADISISRDSPNVLFACMWNAHRPPWSTYAPIEGPGSRLFRSRDGGDTWQPVSGAGFPQGQTGRIGVAVADGTRAARVYAVVESADPAKAGLYRSDDGGDSWTRVNGDPRLTSRGWYFNSITADPNDPDILYDPNVAFYKVTDAGKNVTILRGAPGGDDYHQVWIDPANSAHMVLGSDQGTSVSLDGGKTWSSWYNQPTAQFYHVTTNNAFPYSVFGAQQDSGTAATLSRTDHGEIDLRDWFTVGGSESGYIAPDPRNPELFYVSDVYGGVLRVDRKNLQAQDIAPWPDPGAFGKPINERKYRDPWTPVLVFSPAQTNALYLGTQYVMRTLDGGLHWQKISGDLSGGKTQAAASKTQQVSVDNAQALGYGVVYTIAPSPIAANQIWAGSDTGLVHLTRDAGKTWSDVTPRGLSPWSKIAIIEASHFSPGVAYAAVDRHRLDDQRPYLFRTRDFGKTWQPIVSGIAAHAFVNAVREDPRKKGLLFAGTEIGVYMSVDDGDHWSPLQQNLPVTSVRDLAVHGDDLVIATHGRSFWVMDDIAPLRELSANVSSQTPYLFAPAAAIRLHAEPFAGTPVPPDEPQAKNPPPGAYIDYYLPTDAAGEVTLTIMDIHGNLVRAFSTKQLPPKPPENVPIAPRWIPKPEMLSASAGMHRFIWDLRYGVAGNEAASPADSEEQPRTGPLLPPGRYRITLTVDGHSFNRRVDVKLDPRVQASYEELEGQFAWAKRAFDNQVSARKTVFLLQSLNAQINDRLRNVKPEQSEVRALATRVQQQIAQILTGGNAHDQGLQEAARNLSAAMNAINSADRTPTAQSIEFYKSAATLLAQRTRDWKTLRERDFAALNRDLANAQLTPLNLTPTQQ
jgi:photosystem II stability/assembly factor-like uncharacterized protein